MIPIDEVFHFDVITSNPSTGAAVDADSTPTFAVYEEATDTDLGVGGNLTKRTSLTGNYRGSFTCSALNGFEAGKWYSVIASAVVGGVAGKTVAASFRVAPAESVAGVPKVDVGALSGDATAADNAESFFDGTGYAGTNNVIPTVTTLTNAPSDPAGVTTLLTRASEARLAELDAANLPADIDAILLDTGTDGVVVAAGSKSGYSLTTAPPTAAAIADQVWDETAADHVTVGSTGKKLTDAGNAGDPWNTALPGAYASGTAGWILGGLVSLANLASTVAASVWAYATRTLTTAVSGVTVPDGSAIIIRQGDRWSHTFTGVDTTGYTKLILTVKRQKGDTDAEALVQIVLESPTAATDGLLRLNGAAATASQGSLTVPSATSVTAVLKSAATAALPMCLENLVYDLKKIVSDDDDATTQADSTATITGAVTEATS